MTLIQFSGEGAEMNVSSGGSLYALKRLWTELVMGEQGKELWEEGLRPLKPPSLKIL